MALAILGTLFHSACDPMPKEYLGTAFLSNGTGRSYVVGIYRLQSTLDCSRAITDPATWPGRDAFTLDARIVFGPYDVLLLDRGAREVGIGIGGSASFTAEAADASIDEPSCDAVLLTAEGLTPLVATWSGLTAMIFEGPEGFAETANDEHGLILERLAGRLFIKGTSLIHVLPAGFVPAASTVGEL